MEENSSFKVAGANLIEKIKELIHQGNIRSIKISDENGKVLLAIPLTAGIVIAAISPILIVLGGLISLSSNYEVEIVKEQES